VKRLFLALLLVAAAVRADAPYPPASIYNLSVTLTNQSGAQHGLDVYEGHPVLITMFYGSCPMTCPLLIETLRATERASSAQQQAELRVLLISIDPEHDTVESLQALARSRRVDSSRWTLARTDEASVRKIAAILNIQHRRLPDGNYNHSSVISLLNRQGEIVARSSVLGKADEALLRELRRPQS
jgi:protein SCO1/2